MHLVSTTKVYMSFSVAKYFFTPKQSRSVKKFHLLKSYDTICSGDA